MAAAAANAATMQRTQRPGGRMRYASFESRFVAAVLDLLVMFIIAAILVIAGSLVVLVSSDFERTDPTSTSIAIFWGCVGATLPAFLLYFFIGFALKGQTVGAAVMQLRVVRSDGRALGPIGAAGRVIGLLVYVLIAGAGILLAVAFRNSTGQAAIAIGVALFLVFVGFVMAVFDGRRRTLQDRIAGTIVVRFD
ncbi:MAG: RDD family protein [Dehalococcoidia bacterium]